MDMFDHTSSSSVAVEQLMEQSVQNDRIFRRDTLLRVRKIQSVLTVSSMRKPSWAVTTISPTKEAPPRRTPVFSRREHERLVQATIKPSSILEREIVARELETDDDDYRHWSPASQPYTTAEVLLQYLRGGWECMNEVTVKSSRCASNRCVELYSFEISNGQERLCVPVVSNPVILRLIRECGLTVTSCGSNP